MRLHREVRGELGEPRSGSAIPVIPARWRLPAMLVTIVVCCVILGVAVVYGLAHG